MSSLFLIVSHEMFGTGVGFCTNAVTGQCLPVVLSEGLPEWSLEHKTSSSASEPSSGTPSLGHQLPSVNCDKSALAAGAKRPREQPPLSSECSRAGCTSSRTLLAVAQEMWTSVSLTE